LGVVLYEMSTLQRPFQGSLKALPEIILKGEYTPLNSIYSDALKNLVASFLRVEPSERLELQEALQQELLKTSLQKAHKVLGIESPRITMDAIPPTPTPPKSPPKSAPFRRYNLRTQIQSHMDVQRQAPCISTCKNQFVDSADSNAETETKDDTGDISSSSGTWNPVVEKSMANSSDRPIAE